MTKEIKANGSTAVITTDSPIEQTIVIEPKPLDSVSFMGVEVHTGDLWFALIVTAGLVLIHKFITFKR